MARSVSEWFINLNGGKEIATVSIVVAALLLTQQVSFEVENLRNWTIPATGLVSVLAMLFAGWYRSPTELPERLSNFDGAQYLALMTLVTVLLPHQFGLGISPVNAHIVAVPVAGVLIHVTPLALRFPFKSRLVHGRVAHALLAATSSGLAGI